MSVVFMGTPELAAETLQNLAPNLEISAVFTRPDAIRGRGKSLVPSPVKIVAEELGIPVHTATTLRSPEVQQTIADLKPEAIIVVAYGAILPPEVLAIPPLGCINLHPSALPKWRGAAPLERAILAGEQTIEVTTMLMDEGLDTGPVCLQEPLDIKGLSKNKIISAVASLGSKLLLETLEQLSHGTLTPTPQAEGATYAEKLSKGELHFNIQDEASHMHCKVCASCAAHSAKVLLAGRPVTILEAWPLECIGCQGASENTAAQLPNLSPGELAFVSKRLLLGTTNGILEVTSLKPDGKGPMAASAFGAGLQNLKDHKGTWEPYE